MANSVDPDQTAPIGAVCSGSTLIASILNSSVMLGKMPIICSRRLQQTTFQMHFFLGALRVKIMYKQIREKMFIFAISQCTICQCM